MIMRIFQLKENEKNRDISFMSYEYVHRVGKTVRRKNYNMVWKEDLNLDLDLENESEKAHAFLETQWHRFNMEHPEGFNGHSMSMSDVILLVNNGIGIVYYTDTIGFKEITDEEFWA